MLRRAGQGPPGALVGLVSRLVLGQAVATGAISLAFARRSVTWLLFTLMVTVTLCCLAGPARTGTHGAWLAVVTAESAIVAAGFARLLWSADYLGGLLFAMGTLAVALHPAVSRGFTAAGRTAATAPAGPAADLLAADILAGDLLVSESGRADGPAGMISGGTALPARRGIPRRGPASRQRRSRYDLNARHTV